MGAVFFSESAQVFFLFFTAASLGLDRFVAGGRCSHGRAPSGNSSDLPGRFAYRVISNDIEGAVLAGEISWGNAVDDGSQAGRRGWFIGHFLAPESGPAATDMVEVKWGVHAAGEVKAIEGVNQTATTMSLLVSGRFRLDFPSHGRSITLVRPGDYAVWSPGVSHRWHVLEDAVVITVRWPSRRDDQSERSAEARRSGGAQTAADV